MLKIKLASIITMAIASLWLFRINEVLASSVKPVYLKELDKQIQRRELKIKNNPKDREGHNSAVFIFEIKNPNDQIDGLKYLASKLKLIKDSNIFVVNSKTIKKYGFNEIWVVVNSKSETNSISYPSNYNFISISNSQNIDFKKLDDAALNEGFSKIKWSITDKTARFIEWKVDNYRCLTVILHISKKSDTRILSSTNLLYKHSWLALGIYFNKNTSDSAMKKVIKEIISNLELIDFKDTPKKTK